jgi:glycosyltransferase involved in cell wall biosynthesis
MPDVISELKSLKVAETSKIYLHIARCHKVKNQELLVQAFSNFISEGYDAILVIIGQDYQTDMGKHLQSIAPKDVHFLGTRKNVSDYMLASDCFCLSSIFEGLPITMIEASLAGKPIVSTPVMGAYEIIENGVNGIICNTNEVNDYKECLVTSYKNLSLLTDGADKKKKKSKYTIAVCARKYIDLFLK